MRRLSIDELRVILDEQAAGVTPPADEDLARWASGGLSEDQKTRLLERVTASPAGIEAWRVADELARGAEKLGVRGGPRRFFRLRNWAPPARRLAAVAAVALVAVAAGMLLSTRTKLLDLRQENRSLKAQLASGAARGAPGIEILAAGRGSLRLETVRGTPGPVPELRLSLPPAGEHALVLLSIPSEGTTSVEVGIFGDTDTSRWTEVVRRPADAEPQERLELLVRIPRTAISPPGRYHLMVVSRGASSQVFQVDLKIMEPGHGL